MGPDPRSFEGDSPAVIYVKSHHTVLEIEALGGRVVGIS